MKIENPNERNELLRNRHKEYLRLATKRLFQRVSKRRPLDRMLLMFNRWRQRKQWSEMKTKFQFSPASALIEQINKILHQNHQQSPTRIQRNEENHRNFRFRNKGEYHLRTKKSIKMENKYEGNIGVIFDLLKRRLYYKMVL